MERPSMDEFAQAKAAVYHRAVVNEVAALVAGHRVVVVGMAWNPNCGRARRALDTAGIEHQYHEIGSYVSKWKERLAVKLWSGWPTYPQVFVDGVLIGGADQTEAAVREGRLS